MREEEQNPPALVPFHHEAQVREYLGRLALTREDESYVRVHMPRFRRALETVSRCVAARRTALPEGERPLVLDIAPHLLTDLLIAGLDVQVNTVGVRHRTNRLHPQAGQHLDFDLNAAHKREGWAPFMEHDVVLMGEIIEHLHASPRMLFGCVSHWVKDGGYLVIQTPNAACLEHRLTLLFGANPFMMLLEGDDPGHIREYTAAEIEDLAGSWHFELLEAHYENYFRVAHRSTARRLLYGLLTRWPRTLRDGMTLVLRKSVTLAPRRERTKVDSPYISGALDHVSAESHVLRVVGWAVDAERNAPPPIELALGRQPFHQVTPDLPRPDLSAAVGSPDPRCGFDVQVPAPPGLDLETLEIRARDRQGRIKKLVLASEAQPGGHRER